jgi:hypothetical protein
MLDQSSAVDEHDSTQRSTRVFTSAECLARTITPWKQTRHMYVRIHKQKDDKTDEEHPLSLFCEKIFLNTIRQHDIP